MADNFFCIDIGENLLKIVDAKYNANQLDITSMGYAESDATFFSVENEKVIENQTEKIQKLINGLKLTKKNAVAVIPDSVTYSQVLEMPRLNEKELISAIKYQADQFIPMPIEETNIDLEVLSENEKDNKLLVLMVAAPKKIIQKVQKTIELAGLIPESIENELSATGRFLSSCYKTLYPKITSSTLLVNLAYNATALYYFNPSTSLIYQIHTFPIGYSLFLKELQINVNTDNKKAADILSLYEGQTTSSISVESIIAPLLKEFASEVKRFMSLINEKYHTSISHLYIMNDGFRFPYLPLYLVKTFSLPAELLNPYSLSRKSNLVETYKKNLSLFIPTIGGNLR